MPAVFDTLHAARWRAVGTRFLRQRPFVAALGALGNAALLAASGAPRAQVVGLATLTGALVLAFAGEAAALRTRALGERWLSRSLVATTAAIAIGCAASGALESPMLPLLFAPVTVGLAAFGKSGRARGIVAVAVLSIAGLALLPVAIAPTFPPIAAPWRGWMIGWSTLAAIALASLGIAGLVEASLDTARALDRMRAHVLTDSAQRARDADHLGAKVAHEIRNPLTAVKGLMQLLARRPTEDRDRRRFDVALGEIQRVETILSDYLSLARPLAELSPRPLVARSMLEEVAEIIEGPAASRAITITVEGDAGSLVADPRRMREALLNLAQNALDAMPSGGAMTLTAARHDDRVLLSVRDTGSGIDPDLVERLGEEFVTLREGGTGLGLAHARSVARQHGGELLIASVRAVGTTVTLSIPTGAA